MRLKLTPILDGDDDAETIVFIQGWPDDASLWDEAVAALAKSYRCVRVTMPNYGCDKSQRWGYRTEEIVDALAELLDEVGAEEPVTLVLHDWGCYWGHAAHHRRPERVARVVGLDVAPHYEPGPKEALGIMAYQGWLFGAFVLGGPVGSWMTRRFAKLAGAPRDARQLDAWMNYPYRNIWADLVTGRARKLTKGYWPTCPLLFMYGEDKPFHFHSERWLEHVRSVGGEVHKLPCGHWVTRHPSFLDVLTRWLEETSPTVTPREARESGSPSQRRCPTA